MSELFPLVLQPILGLVFLFLVNTASRLLMAAVSARLRLSKGETGNPRTIRLLAAGWLTALLRHHFSWSRDSVWIVVLALQTVCLTLLPLLGPPPYGVANPVFYFIQIFMLSHVVAVLGRWFLRSEADVGPILQQAQRSALALGALVILCYGLNIGVGIEILSQETTSAQSPMRSPFGIVAFLAALVLSPAMRINVRQDVQGWGLERIVVSFSDILWSAFLVTVFLGPLSESPEAIFLETAIRTALLVVVLETVSVFLASVSQRHVDRALIVLLLPLVLLSGFHLFWRGLLG